MTTQELKVLALLQALNTGTRDEVDAAYKAVFPDDETGIRYLDTEIAHSIADGALLTLVPPEIVEAYDAIEKWYA